MPSRQKGSLLTEGVSVHNVRARELPEGNLQIPTNTTLPKRDSFRWRRSDVKLARLPTLDPK